MQTQKTIREKVADADPKLTQALLDQVVAQGDWNVKLQQTQQEQQAWNDSIKKAADSIDTTLVSALANAFDGQKVTDWGATFKKVLAQIAADIVNLAFIKPAIGSVLGALGFGNAAQSFGSFGGLGSLFGGGGTGS